MFESPAVSVIALFFICFADIGDFFMSKFNETADCSISGLTAVADDLVIFGVQAVESGLHNILKILF